MNICIKLIHFTILLALMLASLDSFAAKQTQPITALAIVSDRSSATLTAGAHQFLSRQMSSTQTDKINIQIRSVSQLNEIDDAQLQDLLLQSSAILMIAVFAEPVERLLNMQYPTKQRRFVLQSDRRLLKLHHDENGAIFAGADFSQLSELFTNSSPNVSIQHFLSQQQSNWPKYTDWLFARELWRNHSVENSAELLAFLLTGKQIATALVAVDNLRFFKHKLNSSARIKTEELTKNLLSDLPIVWVIDHDTGDRPGDWQLHQAICAHQQWQCFSVLAGWGEASVAAIEIIQQRMAAAKMQNTPWLMISLQDFVIGGGEGRQQVAQLFAQTNVPVLKGIRMSEWNDSQRRLSSQGLPSDSIHYRIAMPELQGVSQSQVLAVASNQNVDKITGVRLSQSVAQLAAVQLLQNKISRWLALQSKTNHDKKVAIIYYNHPPGRHNIGADNLNVVDSLLTMLNALKQQGYQVGEIPESASQLLDLLQLQGVNLPDDQQALKQMSSLVATVSSENYGQWFNQLPVSLQREMIHGPLGQLHQLLVTEIAQLTKLIEPKQRQQIIETLNLRIKDTVNDIHHALDGIRHKGRERALNLLTQLHQEYAQQLQLAKNLQPVDWQASDKILQAMLAMQIEGVRGWGEVPGNIMVWNNQLLIPGVQFGNVFIGPQPPRGWELNEELLHANMSFPPPHQYLAFYHYLQNIFKADALVHVGRHSTYEFLPKRSVGLTAADYPSVVVGDLPSIYPYIVDGVGEGIQAKRRGMAVMIDHLTPPLAITELYDDLLQLRQLIESAEAASDENTRSIAVKALRHKIDVLNLREELIASMDEELQVRGVGFEQIDDEFLLHEVGHYLTNIQEKFMPLGLHVFGQDWLPAAIETMLTSMADNRAAKQIGVAAANPIWRERLIQSPAAEMSALLNALNGGFVVPGKGNDPIRTPDALPTGRNFFALDGSLLPTQIGYAIGEQLSQKVLDENMREKFSSSLSKNQLQKNKQAIILWASDAVRDEGAMIAFGMNLLGVQPEWNSRGIIKKVQRIPLSESRTKRLDVVFTTSGLFRDLYGEHLVLLDKAVLMALDASRATIEQDYPALSLALAAALEPLGEWQQGGDESLQDNQVAANWVEEARALLKQHPALNNNELGRNASLRIFGSAPGAYGAGINRLVERSGAWEDRKQLGEVYLKRMGHAYGIDVQGVPAQDLLSRQLAGVSQTFLGRASHLYGLMDNNDAFDYLGGLNLAIETVAGHKPESAVIDHANSNNLKIQPLSQALLSELRGRFLNPQWIKPLMQQEYAGARTMGSEFVEYLWGWQVTSPDIIDDWVWQQVKAVYIDDQLQLGMDEFLSKRHNRYVQTNMLAVMLVAIDKGFWQADEATVAQLAQQFSQNIIQHGIPGSGHTHANHLMYDFVKKQLSVEQVAQLEQVLALSRVQKVVAGETEITRLQEIQIDDITTIEQAKKFDDSSAESESAQSEDSKLAAYVWWIGVLLTLVVFAGIWRGRQG